MSGLELYNGQTAGDVAAAIAAGFALPWQANTYYDNTTATPGTSANFTMTANRLVAVPFKVLSPVTAARIFVNVLTLGGTNGRYGFYAPGTNGFPDDLIADAGELATFGSTGAKELTGLSQLLEATDWPHVWLSLVTDGTPVLNGIAPASTAFMGGDGSTTYGHVYVAHTYGPLPSTFGTPTKATGSPRIWIRTAV